MKNKKKKKISPTSNQKQNFSHHFHLCSHKNHKRNLFYNQFYMILFINSTFYVSFLFLFSESHFHLYFKIFPKRKRKIKPKLFFFFLFLFLLSYYILYPILAHIKAIKITRSFAIRFPFIP
jgi:hypothetical protein